MGGTYGPEAAGSLIPGMLLELQAAGREMLPYHQAAEMLKFVISKAGRCGE